MFLAYAIIFACFIILVNLVPRINDMRWHVIWKDQRTAARFIGLCLTALACLWVSFAILSPAVLGQDYAILCLLIGVGITWTTSPSISKSWIDYMFHSGEMTPTRRATDKVEQK